ncbi:MAG: PEP-CTERM sorting domain-containing protein [Phycisphaeraceae bacterium]|nr:PEP-CTERM sorting domain-containing protein [Phycisphaeraceae bacterium]
MSRITTMLVAVAFVVMASAASAAINFSYVSDNVGAGLTRYTFTANSTVPGHLVGGFDMTFTADSMNQLNPSGLPTIFQDNNASIISAGLDVNRDSQFLFLSSEVTAPGGVAFENGTQLRAAFVFPAGSPLPAQSINFAQIVVPTGTGNSIQWNGGVSIAGAGLFYNVSGQVPEPATLALLSIGMAGLLRRDSRLGAGDH